MSSDQIDIIPSHSIDKEKWDNCIDISNSPLIYPHTYYLDALTDNWHGIVLNDYEGVMPVPWRKKMGIRYCYDVPFIQQLGYFTTTDVDHNLFVNAFSGFIQYGHYNFNYNNKAIANLSGVKTTANFIIDLADKETGVDHFTKSFIQSLRKAQGYDLSYVPATPGEAIEIYKDHYGDLIKNISAPDYKNFLLLANKLSLQNKCIPRKIINKEGEVLSIALLLKDEKRLYNIINAITKEGRKTEANYLLYEQICNEFTGMGLILDLEGSELTGVKSFYKKLGAIDQPYYRKHINNLPFPLKLLRS